MAVRDGGSARKPGAGPITQSDVEPAAYGRIAEYALIHRLAVWGRRYAQIICYGTISGDLCSRVLDDSGRNFLVSRSGDALSLPP